MSELATAVVSALRAGHATAAAAESLTGGLLCGELVAVPGASDVVRGAIVAYAAGVKTDLLGIPADLIRQHGTVSAETALAMARAVRELMGADWGVSTTGVAGPDAVEGHPVGLAYVAVVGPAGERSPAVRTPGNRQAIRMGTVEAALRLLRDALTDARDT